MARVAELPEQIREFIELSRRYLVQETVEPAKRLGRFTAFSLAAATAFAAGSLLLSIAGLRWIVRVLPEGPNWTAAGYLITVAAIGVVGTLIVLFTARDSGS